MSPQIIYCQELHSLLHFHHIQYGSHYKHTNVIDPKATGFGEITQHNSHYVVQGHSRSTILVQSKACMQLPIRQ